MSNHHKGQHIVPRCYLKYFSFDKQENPHVYVYDKVAGKPYPTSLSKICVEEDIYTPSENSETGANLTLDERRKCYEVNYLKKEVEDKYPDAEILPGVIYQAEGQKSRNITFHIVK